MDGGTVVGRRAGKGQVCKHTQQQAEIMTHLADM